MDLQLDRSRPPLAESPVGKSGCERWLGNFATHAQMMSVVLQSLN